MKKKREHLFSITKKDLDIKAFQSGGPGGQHQNRTNSGVRVTHRASGAVGESRTDRSQHRNKKLAFERMLKTTKFKLWLNRTVHEITEGKTIEEKVEEAIQPENIKTEFKEKGKWTLYTEGGIDGKVRG